MQSQRCSLLYLELTFTYTYFIGQTQKMITIYSHTFTFPAILHVKHLHKLLKYVLISLFLWEHSFNWKKLYIVREKFTGIIILQFLLNLLTSWKNSQSWTVFILQCQSKTQKDYSLPFKLSLYLKAQSRHSILSSLIIYFSLQNIKMLYLINNWDQYE